MIVTTYFMPILSESGLLSVTVTVGLGKRLCRLSRCVTSSSLSEYGTIMPLDQTKKKWNYHAAFA